MRMSAFISGRSEVVTEYVVQNTINDVAQHSNEVRLYIPTTSMDEIMFVIGPFRREFRLHPRARGSQLL
jgi:hypothetical protein